MSTASSRSYPHTPDASLPPLVPDGPRRKMLIEIEVSADFEKRLDNQWEVEREINADRWAWRWAPEYTPGEVAEHIVAMVEGLSHSSIGKEILRGQRISGPEVEFDEATKRELHEQLDDIQRAQIASPGATHKGNQA